ncbi:MAG: hypothetical protein IJ706_00015 [Clostridia bacterium]|nr:hypothetical protein [Clostridia bacterium]
MMKKALIFILSLLFMMTFVACQGNVLPNKDDSSNSRQEQEINSEGSTSDKSDKAPEINVDNELPLVPID